MAAIGIGKVIVTTATAMTGIAIRLAVTGRLVDVDRKYAPLPATTEHG